MKKHPSLKKLKKQEKTDVISDLERRIVEVARSSVNAYIEGVVETKQKDMQYFEGLTEQLDSLPEMLVALRDIQAYIHRESSVTELEREVLNMLKAKLQR